MAFSLKEYRKQKQQSQQNSTASSEAASTTARQTKPFSLAEYRKQKKLQNGYYDNNETRVKQEAEFNNLGNALKNVDVTNREALIDVKKQAQRSKSYFNSNSFLYGDLTDTNKYLDDVIGNIDAAIALNKKGLYQQAHEQSQKDKAKEAIDRYNANRDSNMPTQYLSNLTPEQAVEGAEGAYEYRQENKKNAWDYAKDYFSRGHYAGSTESLGDAITPAFTSTGNPDNVDATRKYNLDGYDEDTQATFELVAANSQKNPLTIAENSTEQTDDVKRYTYMTDEEKSHYNRLYGLKSPDEAEAYHNMILSDINQRIADEKYETTYKNKSTLGKTGTMFAQGFQSGLTGIANTGEALLGIDRSKATPVSEYIASDIRNDTENNAVENIIYDIAQSTGNMAHGMIVSALTGNVIGAAGGWTAAAKATAKATAGTAGNLVFALSQYGSSWREAIDNGESASTAGLYAIQQGVDESATNFLLGGIDAFGNSAARKFLKGSVKDKFVGALDKVMKSEKGKEIMKVLYDSLADMGGEAAQEYVQYFTQNWTQALLGMKDQKGNPVVANFDMLNDEALYSALLGALNAGVLNARSTMRNVRDAAAGRTVQNTATAEQAEQDEAKPKEAAPETAQQETQAPELTAQNISPTEQKTSAIELAAQMNGVTPEEITQNVPEVQLPEGTQSVQITDSEGNVTDALQTPAQTTADVVAETADVLSETADEARTLNEEIQPQTVAEAVQPQTASEAQPQAERTYSPEAQALATEMGISEEAADTILQMERSNESTAEASQTSEATRAENVTPTTAEAATDENNEAVKLSNIKARSSQFPERASKVYNDNYDGGDVVDYDEHMKRAYTAGFNGTPMNDIYDDYYVEHAEAMEAMWHAGSVERAASMTPATAASTNATTVGTNATAVGTRATETATSATPAATNVASAATTPAATATAETEASNATTTTQKKGKDINDLRKISQEKKAAKRRNEVAALSEDYSEGEAKAFVENYDPFITPSEYQDAWDAAVEAGRAHASFDEIDASIMDKLGARTYAIAYNMGSDESYETAQRYSRSTEAEDRTSTKENKQETKTDAKSGLVRDANFKKANLTSTQAKVLDYIGKAIGSPVRFVEEVHDDNGKAVNGTYNNGEILISLDTKDPFMTTFMHESVHRLKAVNPEAYAELRDFVKEATGDDYFSALVEEWGKRYEGDTDYVSEEVVADAMGYVFGDEEGTRRFVESHRELARTLSDVLHDVIRTINNYIKGIGKTGGELTQRQRDVMQPIFERMDEAISLIDAAIKETAEEANEVYHSYAKGLPEAIDEILDGKKKRDNVRLRDFTPVSLVNRGIPDEPMFMKASHMAENILTEEEAKKKGFPVNDKTHYHGLGKELFLKALDAMDGKIEVYRWKTNPDNSYGENDYIVITELTDAAGNTIIVPIVINSRAKENNIMIDVNEVKTVYGKTDLKKYLSKYTNAHYLSRVKEKQASSSGVSGGVQFPATMQTKSPVDGSVADGKKNNNSRSRARYSYAGVNAATADVKTLAEAEKLLAQGEDSEAVRQKTGWFKGMDGKWRFELDDSQITLKYDTKWDYEHEDDLKQNRWRELNQNHNITDTQSKELSRFESMVRTDQTDSDEFNSLYDKLADELGWDFQSWATSLGATKEAENSMPVSAQLADIIDASELFAAYPQLKYVGVTFKTMPKNSLGEYSGDGWFGTISLSNDIRLNADEIKNVLLHEIQHIIQSGEKFASGSNPAYWDDRKESIKLEEETFRKLEKENPKLMGEVVKMISARKSGTDSEKAESYKQQTRLFREFGPGLTARYMAPVMSLSNIGIKPSMKSASSFDLYQNTAGEIEARDTASRRNLTASERRVTAPNLGDENTVFVEGDAGANLSTSINDDPTTHTAAEQKVIEEYKSAVNNRLLNWLNRVNNALSGGDSTAVKMKLILSDVTERVADAVKEKSGIDVTGFKHMFDGSAVQHIKNRHGENGSADMSMRNIEDIARVEYVINNFDNAELLKDDNGKTVYSTQFMDSHNNPAPLIVFEKKVDGSYYVVEAVADSADHKMHIVSTYMQKNSGSITQELNIEQSSPQHTSKTPLDPIASATNNLDDNGKNSNSQKRFSKSVDLDEADMERLENIRKANSHIRYMNDVFDATVTAVTGKSTRTGSAQRAVDFAIKTYSSTADGAELTNTLQTVYDYLSASSKADAQEVYAVVHSIAEDIVNGAQTKNTDMDQQYPGLRKQLRTTRLNVSDTIRKSIPDYNDFRKANMGALKLAKTGGIEVDSFYEELSTQHPELFPVEITNDTDRLLQISEIAGLLKPQMVDGIVYDGGVMTAEEMEVETAALTQKLMNGFFGSMNTVDNTPKYEATIKALKAEHETELTKKQAEVEWYKHAYQEWKANTKSWYSKAYQQWKGNTKDWYSKAYKDWKQNYVERNDINSAKKRIISDVKSLTRMLEHPTDSKHVPDFLRTDLANFLSKIDFSSDYVHPSGDLTQRTLDWQKLQNTLSGILNSQANAIQTGEGTVYMDIDPDIIENMKALNAAVEGGKRLNDMTKDEIKALRETMIAMKKCIEGANKFVMGKKNETVQSRGDATIKQLSQHKNRTNSTNAILRTFDKLFTDDMLDSDARFYTMGKAAYENYKALREGLNTKIFDIQSVSRYFEQIRKENNVTRADMDDWASGKMVSEVQLDSGKTLKFTPAIAMNIYALSKRQQAMGHMLGEGVVIAPFKEGNKYVEQERVRLTKGDIKKISDTLTKEQKAVQDAISANYKVCSAWGNEASMRMYGYEKFTAEDYTAPIETDKDFIPTNTKDVIGNYDIIKNYGFTKNTVEGAKNPIRVRSTFDVYVDHVNKMSNYHAFLAPLSDVQKWFNYRSEDGSGSVRLSIKNALGNDANQYILKLMRNINGFKVDDTYFAKPLISLYKGSAVGFNISVAIQQPTSYLRAIAVVPQKYLLKGLSPAKLKVGTFEDIENYSAIAQWKDWGFFETDVGRSLKSILLGGQTGLQSLNDKQMWLAGKGDEVAWSAMWRACEYWVEDTDTSVEVGSDEYFKKVAEKFDMIIDKTQVVDSPLHRAEIMRSGSELNQIATSFMSEPMKSYNTLYRTMYDAKNPGVNAKSKTEIQHSVMTAFTGWITANVLAAAAKSLVTALRDDDKDKEYWDRWNEAFVEEAIGNLNPLGYIPWVKDIYSILEGYDSSRMDLQIGNDLNYLISRWKKRFSGDSPYTIAGDLIYSLRIVSRATGIGFNSLQRDINGIIDEAISMVGADDIAYQKAKTFKYDVGASSNMKYYVNMALKAYVNGNKVLGDKIVKDMKDAGIDEEKLNTKMKSIMKDNPDMAKQAHDVGGDVGLIAAQAQYSSRVSAEGASKKAEKVDILLDMAEDGDITEDELSTIYEDAWGTQNFTEWKDAGGSTADYLEYAIDISALKVKGNTTNENKEAVIDYIHDQHISKESAAILWELAGYTAERDFDEWYNK